MNTAPVPPPSLDSRRNVTGQRSRLEQLCARRQIMPEPSYRRRDKRTIGSHFKIRVRSGYKGH
ncbi:MAG: hypothetical protein U0805_02600 [Pirellulales bacterium]